MELLSFQVDAFTKEVFGGNPASVVLLERRADDDLLLKIARENNLPETAFIMVEEDHYNLRWFTPDIEMDLCGHATLASAHVIFSHLGYAKNRLMFKTVSGILEVDRVEEGGVPLYTMSLPSRPGINSSAPPEILESLDIKPVEIYKARDYMLVYSSEREIREINVVRSIMDKINLGTGGVIITAPGEDSHFVSRFFTPGATLFEDPVTGSAHCTLVPYWSNRLGVKEMYAKQLSLRGGELFCKLDNDRVLISGNAVTYSLSKINI